MLYEIPQASQDIANLEDYLRAIRERWRLITIIALAGALAAFALSSVRLATYEAEAVVVINPTIANATNNNLVAPTLEREREVVRSISVVQRALEDGQLSGNPTAVAADLEVSFVNNSDTLSIRYVSTDPDEAADIVNLVAQAYVDLREDASSAVYDSQIDRLTDEASSLTKTLDEIAGNLSQAQADRTVSYAIDLENPTRQSVIDEATELVSLLTSDLSVVSNDLAVVNRSLRDLNLSKASRPATAEVLRAAKTPEQPTGVSQNLMIAAGLILGTMAGAALAFTLQRLDRTAKGTAEVEAALGTNVLGSIPNYGLNNRRPGIMMVGTAKGARAQRVRESYRRLRASLNFLQTTQDVKSFIVTSARPGEGKSSTVANLAVAAAQAGGRVVVISADLRRPRIEHLLGVQANRGLSDYLLDPTVSDIMVSVPSVPGLVVVPAGSLPPNPGELLASSRFRGLVEELSGQFDTIFIDTPPVLSAADAGSSSPLVDGVLIIVDSQRTDTADLLKARTSLERAGGNILGAVLNKDRSDERVSLRKDRYSYERVASRR